MLRPWHILPVRLSWSNLESGGENSLSNKKGSLRRDPVQICRTLMHNHPAFCVISRSHPARYVPHNAVQCGGFGLYVPTRQPHRISPLVVVGIVTRREYPSMTSYSQYSVLLLGAPNQRGMSQQLIHQVLSLHFKRFQGRSMGRPRRIFAHGIVSSIVQFISTK